MLPALEDRNADIDAGTRSRIEIARKSYRLRLAASKTDVQAALHLRFLVFNLELNEGLATAFETGYDTDQFDSVCEHLIVEDVATGEVVGTYRLQTGLTALQNYGYYSEREFDFAPYNSMRDSIIELGRACIHPDHRSTEVLQLLWRGIARYAAQHGARYLIGCSSLTAQEPARGTAVYLALQSYLAEPRFRTVPSEAFTMPLICDAVDASVPKLLRAYLAIGARLCGPPAIDREFKTIDFLTLMDFASLPDCVRLRFFR
jgi:putative hemolysin